MSKRKQKRQYSRISKKVFRSYVLSVFFLPVFLMCCFFLAWFICSRFTWYETDDLYFVLKALQAFSPLMIAFCTLAGFIYFTLRLINTLLLYLDEIIDGAKLLAHPDESPILLPEELNDVQNELNLTREAALRNITAAREAEQRKNDLIVYLAHDLKTPLTSIIGYLTLLRDEPQISPELRARYTGIVLDKAERLEDLINEFFDITRFNLTTLHLEPEITDLSRMLEQTTNEFNPILAEKGLTWRLDIAPHVHVFCDRDKLERVFDNLIRNAVNYSYPESEISLIMKPYDTDIELKICNHGKTIAPEKLERIFEQFFRLDASRSSMTGGSGLGLAIAKEIIELHNGTIAAYSENESISFILRLPKNCQEIV